ncbi:MAG: phosphoglucosamine mutase [Bacteroidales bacterium]|nr:phosphoglucosamine mutase [Bacteroidales bacterium]
MALIKSISGIRGTIGGVAGQGLTPVDIVSFTSAFVELIKKRTAKEKIKIVVGRDARISGPMVNHLVTGTLLGSGANVIDGGLSTTPTIEMAVPYLDADGGIILTASHNPGNWNALKLLNSEGEFISAEEGNQLLNMVKMQNFNYVSFDALGEYTFRDDLIDYHIDKILELPLVRTELIKEANFGVALDCVNSTGGIALPKLLQKLGVNRIERLYCQPTGIFPHNPEPLPENLKEISAFIKQNSIDVGFVVDPDVDRLAIISEDGDMFGEEYTLVAVADYILKNNNGNTVSNLSSTRALKDITERHGGMYFASAVGEVNVVSLMKKNNAVIGGEGNGGVIYPESHFGRDALVGIALFLSHLAIEKVSCSKLRGRYPNYYISKNKIDISGGTDPDKLLEKFIDLCEVSEVNTIDGIRLDIGKEWVHLRKSNTEPIIRLYAESNSKEKADKLAGYYMEKLQQINKSLLM